MIVFLVTPANNIPYLFAAYSIAWAFFFGYMFFTSRRQRELERELQAIRDILEKRDSAGETSDTR